MHPYTRAGIVPIRQDAEELRTFLRPAGVPFFALQPCGVLLIPYHPCAEATMLRLFRSLCVHGNARKFWTVNASGTAVRHQRADSPVMDGSSAMRCSGPDLDGFLAGISLSVDRAEWHPAERFEGFLNALARSRIRGFLGAGDPVLEWKKSRQQETV